MASGSSIRQTVAEDIRPHLLLYVVVITVGISRRIRGTERTNQGRYWVHLISGLFYKYNPLHSSIVENEPLQILLSKVTWRKVEKLTRVSSRQSIWRHFHPATRTGGSLFVTNALAEGGGSYGVRRQGST
jgi:hypothetical protein